MNSSANKHHSGDFTMVLYLDGDLKEEELRLPFLTYSYGIDKDIEVENGDACAISI